MNLISEARRQGTAKRPGLKRASGGSAKCRVDQVATDQQLRLASYIVTDHNASTGGYCPAGKVSVLLVLAAALTRFSESSSQPRSHLSPRGTMPSTLLSLSWLAESYLEGHTYA